ncbi:hypothetical protein GGX14DRAFT_47217 [Mycena pura]|uniref:DUF6533 domain-containing protein n=1 Tax=Mycena pura TaxID=153505 RepID=A0AAD6UP31_9AGAR|nr:hypothetical protein GGX14DRAFT_47217 [Mycena pura]
MTLPWPGHRAILICLQAFMIYDHLITFDSEVSRIWTLRWRLPKVLFLINRYIIPPMLIFDAIIPTLFNLSENMCIFIARWTSWPTIVSLGTVECILLLRVFAISGHKKSIRYSLSAFFMCEMAAWVTLSVMIMNGTTGMPGGTFFPGCLFSAPVYFYAAWFVFHILEIRL